MTEQAIIGKCQHCGIVQFDNPDADSALDGMAHLCWRCVKPHGVIVPGMRIRHRATELRPEMPVFGTVRSRDGDDAIVQWDGHDSYQAIPAQRLRSVQDSDGIGTDGARILARLSGINPITGGRHVPTSQDTGHDNVSYE